MKRFILNVFLTAITLIAATNLTNHALSFEANQAKDISFVTQSVLVDQDGKPLFNYYIDANGNVVNLQPFFDNEPDSESRIELSESQPNKTKNQDCEFNQQERHEEK